MIEKLSMGFWIITFFGTYAWQMTFYWSNTAYLKQIIIGLDQCAMPELTWLLLLLAWKRTNDYSFTIQHRVYQFFYLNHSKIMSHSSKYRAWFFFYFILPSHSVTPFDRRWQICPTVHSFSRRHSCTMGQKKLCTLDKNNLKYIFSGAS